MSGKDLSEDKPSVASDKVKLGHPYRYDQKKADIKTLKEIHGHMDNASRRMRELSLKGLELKKTINKYET